MNSVPSDKNAGIVASVISSRRDHHGHAVSHHEAHDRRIEVDQHAVHRVLHFAADVAANRERRERRRERHRQQRREAHRVGLGERERLEEPTFRLVQREDRAGTRR